MGLGGTENVVLQLCEVFKSLVRKIVVCSCGGVNVEKLTALGIVHYQIDDIENKKPTNIVTISHALKKIVSDEHITVIHTHHRMAAFYVEMLGLYKSCTFINTSHNTFANKRLLTRLSYKHAHLITCGKQVKRNLENLYGLKDATVIYNAVKPFEHEISPVSTLANARRNNAFLIGNIARLSEQKGLEYYIKAIPKVKAKHPEAEFFIIGSGEDEGKLKALAQQTNADVTFLGYRSDIQNIMSQLDLVVLSSLWEGLPLTPIEAFSVKKTIVATAVDGTPEVVKDEYNGFHVPARNSNALAEQIIRMIESPQKRHKMEENAFATFKENFSFNIFSQSYIDYYERL